MKLILKNSKTFKYFPVILLGIVFLTYGYQLFRMGLYWDDWEIIYLDHFNDPRAYWDYFLYARPLTSWIYLLLSPLIGMNAVAWQIINILLRWAGMLGFWWALRLVWPKRSFEIAWVCLLLAVYPAFTQHSVAVTYTRHFACIALFSLSLGLNLLAVDNPRRWWMFTIIAALASLLQLITLEYFFGLELLRLIFLWIYLGRMNLDGRTRLRTLFYQWIPYLLVILIFAGYRFVWYPLVSPNPEANAPVLFERLSANPAGEAIKFANLVIQDLIHLNVDNWLAPLAPGMIELRAKANWLSWGAAALITLISAWFLNKSQSAADKDTPPEDSEDHFSRDAIIIGIIGVLAGGIPVWITGRQSIGGPWADRFALGPMFGAVLFLVGLAYWFSRRRLQQSILLGLVFGFALSSQMQTVNKYRLSWDHQNDYHWQLAWRAPAIRPGTAIVGPALPFALVNDLHVGFAVNAIYDQGGKSFEAPLWFFRAGGMQGDLVPKFDSGYPIEYRYLTAHFKGSTDQLLVADYSYATSCLHIVTSDDLLNPKLSNDERMLFALSKPDLIDLHPVKPTLPPESVFGREPEHGWCYTFQKIESALQEQDWLEAARLADEAAERQMTPKKAQEYIPMILAYVRTDQPEKAVEMTLAAQKMDTDQTAYFCALWKTKIAVLPGMSEWSDKTRSKLQCDLLVDGEPLP
jgi:hypothetical protein